MEEQMAIEPEDELMYAAIEETARRIFEGNDFSLIGIVEDAGGERQTFEIGPESEGEAMAKARREVADRNARAFAVIGLGSMEMEAEEGLEGEGSEEESGDVPVLVVYRQGSGDAQVEIYVAPFNVGPDEEGDDSMEIGELESHGVLPESWLG